jgi:hypothetical protein
MTNRQSQEIQSVQSACPHPEASQRCHGHETSCASKTMVDVMQRQNLTA